MIREHINSIPQFASNYCRSRTSKEYVDGSLNLTQIYRLYAEILNFKNLKRTDVMLVRHFEIITALQMKTEFCMTNICSPRMILSSSVITTELKPRRQLMVLHSFALTYKMSLHCQEQTFLASFIIGSSIHTT